MAYRVAVPDQLSALPLFRELEADGECEVVRDTPANVGIRFSGGSEHFDAALITPLDYARHGGPFRILPGIGVSVSGPTGTSRLRVRQDASAVATIAADLRSTYDLALATLLLREKYPGLGSIATPPSIVPVSDTSTLGFERSDAVLDWFPYPAPRFSGHFALDVYEEWVDLTEVPLVLLLWVVRDDVESVPLFRKLASAFQAGTASFGTLAGHLAGVLSLSEIVVNEFFARHSYGLTHQQVDAMDTLFRVAYSYGMLGDVPDIQFLDPTE